MGLLKNIVSTAVSDGIRKGVGNFDKKVEPKKAEDPYADLKDAAKGIFKKFLG